MAYARKNPILAKSEGLSLVSPLRDVIKIPIILSVCSDDPFAQDLVDESFFRYQKFVLGFDIRA